MQYAHTKSGFKTLYGRGVAQYSIGWAQKACTALGFIKHSVAGL